MLLAMCSHRYRTQCGEHNHSQWWYSIVPLN